jgi:tetratricopeptide (TPR) repeat protein
MSVSKVKNQSRNRYLMFEGKGEKMTNSNDHTIETKELRFLKLSISRIIKTNSIIGLNLLSIFLLAAPSHSAILDNRSISSKATAWVAGNNDTCDKKRQSAEYYYRLSMSAIEESVEIYCLNKAIKVNPKYFKAYDRRGNAKRKIGDLKGAIADYNVALKINSKYGQSYYNRALAKKESNDPQGAIADYNKAIEIFRLNKDNYELDVATKALEELKSKSSVTP